MEKTINGKTFFSFCNMLRGLIVLDKKTEEEVYKYQLFYKGYTLPKIKDNYKLIDRE